MAVAVGGFLFCWLVLALWLGGSSGSIGSVWSSLFRRTPPAAPDPCADLKGATVYLKTFMTAAAATSAAAGFPTAWIQSWRYDSIHPCIRRTAPAPAPNDIMIVSFRAASASSSASTESTEWWEGWDSGLDLTDRTHITLQSFPMKFPTAASDKAGGSYLDALRSIDHRIRVAANRTANAIARARAGIGGVSVGAIQPPPKWVLLLPSASQVWVNVPRLIQFVAQYESRFPVLFGSAEGGDDSSQSLSSRGGLLLSTACIASLVHPSTPINSVAGSALAKLCTFHPATPNLS